jgi:hypothetical protein
MADVPSDATLLDIIFAAGINIVSGVGAESTSATVYPHYRGNPGFYHILESDGEALLLKGVYGDSVRILKKGITLSQDEFISVSRLLFEVKKALLPHTGENYMLRLAVCDGEILVALAESYTWTPRLGPDPYIPRPLTAGEYEGPDNLSGGKTLYSRGFLRSLFPETASPYLQDLAKRFPDILAFYFLAFDIKIPSPSITVLGSRLYANISALLAGFEGARIDPAVFRAGFMPWQGELFKNAADKPKPFLQEKMTPAEITSLLDEISASVKNKGGYALFNDDFYEPLPRICFAAFFFNFLFSEELARLKRLTEFEETELLRAVFISRKSSFFIAGAELEIPEYFDPSFPALTAKFAPGEAEAAVSLTSRLSPLKRFRRRKKIEEALASLHTALDGRDALLKIAGGYHKTIRKALLEHGGYVKTRKKIYDENQIFLFESSDIRRLVNDSFYSNIEPVLEYKENYMRRCAAQTAAYDIYGEDVKYFGLIAEKQTAKVLEGSNLSCRSYGVPEEIKGVASCLPTEGEIYCANIASLASLSRLEAPKAVLCDLAAPFSYVTEYCVINKIPLYYAVRFPELLSGKFLILKKADITYARAE